MKRAYLAFAALALIACASADEIDQEGNILAEDDDIPTTPGDNSFYIDGKSRYIWFPDGLGSSVLVDLLAPVNMSAVKELTKQGYKIKYWLYTRDNIHSYQSLVHGDKGSVTSSNYRADRPTNVIVHGFKSNGNAQINIAITAAFLNVQDCNVIVVDWSQIADRWNYPAVAAAVPTVGKFVGGFLIWLFTNVGGNWDTLHLVGHSLGAHVVGNAGRATTRRARRVTGLDPAGPLWKTNSNALDTAAGRYVEAIHTNTGFLGLRRPVGDADFYPNGGSQQPGCWKVTACSHSRAYELFAATVTLDRLNGRVCADLQEAEKVRCNGDRSLKMGNSLVDKTGNGIYGLITGESWPF